MCQIGITESTNEVVGVICGVLMVVFHSSDQYNVFRMNFLLRLRSTDLWLGQWWMLLKKCGGKKVISASVGGRRVLRNISILGIS